MKEKNIKWIIAGIIVLLSIAVLLLKLSDRKIYLDEVKINKEQFESITSQRSKTEEKLVKTIKFNNYDLIFDKLENRWFYSIIENNINSYNPYIEYISRNENNKKINIAIEEKEINNELIEKNESIKMIIYTETEYNIYSLTCTSLPIINIEYNEKEDIDEDEKITNMKIYVFDNRKDSKNRVINSEGTIHKRGRSTAFFEKKGYKIKLENDFSKKGKIGNDVSLLGMRQDNDWILYAGYNDQEKIRNVFSSKIWYESCADNNEYGIKNGMEYKYVELFFNNEYWGLYALGFPIDEKQLELSNQDALFKKYDWDYSEYTVKDDTKTLDGYDIKTKSENEEEKWDKIIDYYKEAKNIEEKEDLEKIADINNCIDIYLYLNLVQGIDNTQEYSLKNLFVSIKNGKALYAPWDLDNTFGNSWSDLEDEKHKNHTNQYWFKPNENIIMKSNLISYLRIDDNEELSKMIKERYEELRKTSWKEENLEKILAEYENDIYYSGAFLRDRSRWPDGNYNHNSTKLKIFKDYVRDRLKYMDEYIENEE